VTRARAADVLLELGMTGILTLPPEDGGVTFLLCEMDVCYSPRGRGYFERMSRDSEGRLVHWMPTEEHWPIAKADRGHRVKGNVWLAHRLCNKLAYGVGPGYDRKRQQALDRQNGWLQTHIDDYLSAFGNRESAEELWKQRSSRKAAHPDLSSVAITEHQPPAST
jgi:hypothetical protein